MAPTRNVLATDRAQANDFRMRVKEEGNHNRLLFRLQTPAIRILDQACFGLRKLLAVGRNQARKDIEIHVPAQWGLRQKNLSPLVESRSLYDWGSVDLERSPVGAD
jgi:hypothetical protein